MADRPVRVYCSYSHNDERLLNQLEPHLKVLQRQGIIEAWTDKRIVPGDTWADRIDEKLERADLILFLVSSDFIASDYCYDIEVKRALERHASGQGLVIPVIVRPVNWKGSPLASFRLFHETENRSQPGTTSTAPGRMWLRESRRPLKKSYALPGENLLHTMYHLLWRSFGSTKFLKLREFRQ
jgi:hypothetical protein